MKQITYSTKNLLNYDNFLYFQCRDLTSLSNNALKYFARLGSLPNLMNTFKEFNVVRTVGSDGHRRTQRVSSFCIFVYIYLYIACCYRFSLVVVVRLRELCCQQFDGLYCFLFIESLDMFFLNFKTVFYNDNFYGY